MKQIVMLSVGILLFAMLTMLNGCINQASLSNSTNISSEEAIQIVKDKFPETEFVETYAELWNPYTELAELRVCGEGFCDPTFTEEERNYREWKVTLKPANNTNYYTEFVSINGTFIETGAFRI